MFLDAFGAYDFLVRESLVLLLVVAAIYVVLNAGFFALPQIGFMATGAYTSAILSDTIELPMALSLICAILVGAAAGFILTLLLVRLNGIYLAMATIAFGEMVRVVARNLDVTGGPNGISGIERSATDYWIVGAVVVTFAGLVLFARSRHGLAARAMRQDILSAAHQGINVRAYRIGFFMLSGALAAAGGSLYVHLTGFVQPGSFNFDILVTVLAAVVVGGMVSVLGPLLGALVIFGMPEVLRPIEDYRMVVNGVLIVVIIAFAPRGLASVVPWVRGYLFQNNSNEDEPSVELAASVLAASSTGVQTAPSKKTAPSDAEPLLQIDGLELRFGGIRALDGVTFDVMRGEVLGVIGPNGSGKTTVLNVLSGAYVPLSGQIRLEGEDFKHKWGRPDRISDQGIARTFQTIRLIEEDTVLDNVLVGCHRHRPRGLSPFLTRAESRRDREARATAAELVKELDLESVASRPAGDLPYGTQRRVEIARALASQPKLLLLDEPTAGMGPEERESIFTLIQQVRARGVTVMVVEHDVDSMRSNCDRLVVLNFGRVIASGLPDEVMQDEEVIDAYIGQRARD